MKRAVKRILCLCLTLLLLWNTVDFSVALAAGAEDEAAAISEEAPTAWVEEAQSFQITDAIFDEPYFEEGEEIAGMVSGTIAGTDEALGSDTETIPDEGGTSDLVTDTSQDYDPDESWGTPPLEDLDYDFDESLDQPFEGEISDDQIGVGIIADVKPARTSVAMGKGGAVTVNVKIVNAPKSSTLRVAVWKNAITATNAVKYQWGAQSGNSRPLTLTSSTAGTYRVAIYLFSGIVPVAAAWIGVTVCDAKLTLSSNSSSQRIKIGATNTIYVSASGYSGSSMICVGSTNGNAYSCSLGTMRGGKVPLTIKGLRTGGGTVTVYYKTKAGDTLASRTFSVSVVSDSTYPSIKSSRSAISLAAGQSISASISHSGYSGNVYYSFSSTNNSAFSCVWSGTNLTITGKAAGSGTVYVYLYATASKQRLASTAISVSVSGQMPKITLDFSSISITANQSKTVGFTVKNTVGKLYYQCSNSNICAVSFSTTSAGRYNMCIVGKNAGTATITLSIRASSGDILTSAALSVKVQAEKPWLKASTTSLTLKPQGSGSVRFTYGGCATSIKLSYSRASDNSVCSLSWSQWSGTSIDLKISGRAAGSDTVTVNLLRASDNAKLASVTLRVNVEASYDIDIREVSYKFSNYSTHSLSACKYMYGNTQIAQNVYQWIGGGGQCFGMATSSGLLYGGAVSVSSFNSAKRLVSQLDKSNQNASLSLTVKQFIEAMHVSQAATAVVRTYGIDQVARRIISEIDQGKVIFLGVGGHRIMAYDYSVPSSTELNVAIYDSNYPLEPQTMRFKRSGSTYAQCFYRNYLNGSSSDGSVLNYITYDTMSSVWNQRGHLTSTRRGNMSNMIFTDEMDFTLYSYDPSASDLTQQPIVAQCVDGTLVQAAESVSCIPLEDLTDENGEARNVLLLIVPTDYYYVTDDSKEDGICMSIVGELLSSTVETDAHELGLCADDLSNAASVWLAPGNDQSYSITIGSSREDSAGSISVEGVGTGNIVSLGLESMSLSLGIMEGLEDATIAVYDEDTRHYIDASTAEGGTITNAGSTAYSDGESARYEIVPSEGFTLDAVYVDGENIGAVDWYYFENITSDHSIYATFMRDISTCDIVLEQSQDTQLPVLSLVSSNGYKLEENLDYILGYEYEGDSMQPIKVVAMALPGSGFTGSVEKSIAAEHPAIQSAELSGTILYVAFQDSWNIAAGTAILAMYADSGALVRTIALPISSGLKSIQFDLEGADLHQIAQMKIFLLTETSYSPQVRSYDVEFST